MIPLNNAKITSIYGKLHTGLDLISTSGDKKIKSIGKGIVRGVFFDGDGYGKYVSVQLEDGRRALYCHLETANVSANQRLNEGDIIGIEGNTGNSEGIHLHLEIREAPYGPTRHINPADYLGIINEKGLVRRKAMTKFEQMQYIQKEFKFSDGTMAFLDCYKFNEELFKKMVARLQGGNNE